MNEQTPASPNRGPSHYRVGDLLIDVGRQQVTRGGDVIALPKLSYDLLITLVREAPNLVSNDTLMERVWRKLVVSPETVSQRIKLLRDALGDDPCVDGQKVVHAVMVGGVRSAAERACRDHDPQRRHLMLHA